MRHLLFFSFAALFSASAFAQLSFFKAEGRVFYEVHGCRPKTDVAFYSNRGGGKLIKTMTVDDAGCLRVCAQDGFRPAFVLNSGAFNAVGRRGTGKVYFFDYMEFNFDAFEFSVQQNAATLSWKAEVLNGNEMFFDVQKSLDGVAFTKYAIIDAHTNQGLHQYAVTDQNYGDAFYRIIVQHRTKGTRYTSTILGIENSGVKVLPTASNGEFTLRIKKKDIGAKYDIINQQGQLIASGLFERETSVIDASAYASGAYFVVVYASGDKHTAKFFRL